MVDSVEELPLALTVDSSTAQYSRFFYCRIMFSISCGSICLEIVLLLVLICTLSDTVRYRLKFFIFIFVALLATCGFPLMLLRPRNWRNALIPAWIITLTLRLIGVKYTVRGKENIVKDSGAVILMNHQSAIDLAVLGELWSVIDNCAVISKVELLKYTGPFGWAAYLWGTIFIDRNKVKDARDAMNATADIVQKNKVKLMIFPEGTRHSDNTLRPFKKGAFHVAVSGQVPIQPIVVSKYYFLNSKSKYFGSGQSYITILPPISTEGLTKDDVDSLITKTRELMNKEFKKTTDEALREANVLKAE